MTSQALPKIASPTPSPFRIDPPLLNSSNPWATTESDLLALYACPHTGAVTIRTSLWKGFTQHPSTHQYTFFSTALGHASANIAVDLPEGRSEVRDGETSSLNTLGYSPIAFETYMNMLIRMSRAGLLLPPPSPSSSPPSVSGSTPTPEKRKQSKPFIVSVTGTAAEVAQCATHIHTMLNSPETIYPLAPSSTSSCTTDAKPSETDLDLDLLMEINLSCPNIPSKPPPAYSLPSLTSYITALRSLKSHVPRNYTRPLHIGIKVPPYTHDAQFQTLISALENSANLEEGGGGCPISFITATNTLGNCLVLNGENEAALGSMNGTGIGGMAGEALHPLALGNVRTIRSMLDSSPYAEIRNIAIIGIGGVSDVAGFRRMRSVGAAVVGVGTALGREGVEIFSKISAGLSQSDLAV